MAYPQRWEPLGGSFKSPHQSPSPQLIDTIREIPKHNVLIIGGDFNAHLGQDNGYTFAYYQTTNINGQILNYLLSENNLICLIMKFQKREGHLWTHLSPNNLKYYIR